MGIFIKLTEFILIFHIITYCEGVYTIDGEDLVTNQPRTPVTAHENKKKTLFCFVAGNNRKQSINWYYQPDAAKDTKIDPGFFVLGTSIGNWCGENRKDLSNNITDWCLQTKLNMKMFNLVLKNVQIKDEGIFTCRVDVPNSKKCSYGGYKLSVIPQNGNEVPAEKEEATKVDVENQLTFKLSYDAVAGIVAMFASLIAAIVMLCLVKCKKKMLQSKKSLDVEEDIELNKKHFSPSNYQVFNETPSNKRKPNNFKNNISNSNLDTDLSCGVYLNMKTNKSEDHTSNKCTDTQSNKSEGLYLTPIGHHVYKVPSDKTKCNDSVKQASKQSSVIKERNNILLENVYEVPSVYHVYDIPSDKTSYKKFQKHTTNSCLDTKAITSDGVQLQSIYEVPPDRTKCKGSEKDASNKSSEVKEINNTLLEKSDENVEGSSVYHEYDQVPLVY